MKIMVKSTYPSLRDHKKYKIIPQDQNFINICETYELYVFLNLYRFKFVVFHNFDKQENH